jgi:hypothetical protein
MAAPPAVYRPWPVSTGQRASAITRSATLSKARRAKPVRP